MSSPIATHGIAALFAGFIAAGPFLPSPAGAEVPESPCRQSFLREPGGLLRLSSATAAPGEEVRLSLFATPDWDTGSFNASIDFDEEALEVLGIERVFIVDLREWGHRHFDFSNENVTPGNAGVCEEGFIAVAGGGFSGIDERGIPIEPYVYLPQGVETELVTIAIRVRAAAPPGETLLRFQNGAPDRRPPIQAHRCGNSLGSEDGEGLRAVHVIHGSVTVEGPPVAVEAPRRYSLGGLGDLVSTIAPSRADGALSAVAPAGDVDGDGREDLLVRVTTRSDTPAAEDEEVAVLLYGLTAPRRSIDPLEDLVRKTVIRTPATHLNSPGGLAGGEDLDGDGLDDFLVVTGPGHLGEPSRLLLICGSRSLPKEVDVEDVGAAIRGSVIFDSSPPDPDEIVGLLAILSPDLNGDGLPDAVITETADLLVRRRAFVLFGSSSLPPSIDLQEIGGTIPGLTLEASGLDVDVIDDLVPLGDVDGDGIADLGIACGRSAATGSARYLSLLVYGRRDFPGKVVLDALGAGEAVRFPCYNSMARGGDVDGDGLEDPVIFQLLGELADGEAHIVRGRSRGEMPAEITAEMVHAGGFALAVAETRDCYGDEGFSTSPYLNLTRGTDIDGDGRAEVILASRDRSVHYGDAGAHAPGSAFVLRGGGPLSGRLTTDRIQDGRGFRLDGIEPGGGIGFRLFALDGFAGSGGTDLLLAAWRDGCAALDGQPSLAGLNLVLWIVPARALLAEDLSPRLAMVHPERGALTGGEPVLLLGAGFGPSPRVYFGDKAARVRSALGDGILVAEAPAAALPTAVRVRIENDRGATGENLEFTYMDVGRSFLDVAAAPGRVLTVRHVEAFDGTAGGMAFGDFNGDGNLDLAVASRWANLGELHETRYCVQLVFGDGTREGLAGGGPVDLGQLELPQGVTLWAPPASAFQRGAGSGAIQSGGDVNDDGFDDLILNAQTDQRLEEWHLILGREEYYDGLSLDDPDRLVRFVLPLLGVADTGSASRIVPDLDGDGVDDLILTGWTRYETGDRRSLYLIRGRPDFPPAVDLETVAEQGFGALYYSSHVFLTSTAGPAGDFNGDGRGDLFFAGQGRLSEGAVLILYGGDGLFPGRAVELSAGLLGDVGGLLVTGPSIFSGVDTEGFTVPGDLDGDGTSDLFFSMSNEVGCTLWPDSGSGFILDREAILGAGFDPVEFPFIGEMYTDEPMGFPDMAVRADGGQNGVLALRGTRMGYSVGAIASPAGDFNADGFEDLLIGSAGDIVTVLYGAPDLKARDLEIPDLTGRALTIRASAQLLAGGFDWDRDGVGDIAIGSEDGVFHIVFGERLVRSEFIRGDSDLSGIPNVTDAIVILGYLFLGSANPTCLDACDTNDDGVVILTDAIYLLSFLFLGGSSPPLPFPAAGTDPTDDSLSCQG